MKLNELKKIAYHNEYSFKEDNGFITLLKKDEVGDSEIIIDSRRLNHIWINNNRNRNKKIINMTTAAMDFDKTPISERGLFKSYAYMHKSLKSRDNKPIYLNIINYPYYSYPTVSERNEDIEEFGRTIKAQFTDDESKKLKFEEGINLEEFIKVEAENEEMVN